MADGVEFKLDGTDELKRILALSPIVATKAVRVALRKAGNLIVKAARANAPELKTPTKNRKPGTIKRSIVVRFSKIARQAGDEGVFVGVRPLRGKRQKKLGQAGATNPNDPYYWMWQEFGWTATGPKKIRGGTRAIPGKKFLSKTESLLPEAKDIFMNSVIPAIEKLNKRAGL